MGLSRNKVAVSEGAAGSPPFYGECVLTQTRQYVFDYGFRRIPRKTVVQFSGSSDSEKLVTLTQRVHPFPFRTRKLSFAVPKILCGRLHGKIGRCQHVGECKNSPMKNKNPIGGVAQLGEHLPCKQGVMGSNPIISTNGVERFRREWVRTEAEQRKLPVDVSDR